MTNTRKRKFNAERLIKIMFVFSLCILIFCYGYATHRFEIFPAELMEQANIGIRQIFSYAKGKKSWYYRETDETVKVPVYDKNSVEERPSLVTSIATNNGLSARVIGIDATLIHEWKIDWHGIWPNATHIPEKDIPKARPGTHIHGAVLLDNGDLVFNFEHLGLVRLNVCGDVVWRLPYRTHHSIHKDERGNLWVSGQINHDKPLEGLPNYKPPFIEPTVIKVSQEGEVLTEISVLQLLKENGREGLLYMSTTETDNTEVTDDTMHLNDVETFPDDKEEGVFKSGDIMLSLRNINTVLVFSEADRKIKHISVGEFVRQHDPDFIDGNTISVFDNYNIAPDDYGHQSKIYIKSFKDNDKYVYYTGNKDKRFYTDLMGKHQWLPNGNLLITESAKGRAFEIDEHGNIVWEYFNIIEEGYVGVVEEVTRLPHRYNKAFFEQQLQKCGI